MLVIPHLSKSKWKRGVLKKNNYFPPKKGISDTIFRSHFYFSHLCEILYPKRTLTELAMSTLRKADLTNLVRVKKVVAQCFFSFFPNFSMQAKWQSSSKNLAKFGYIPDINIKIKNILLYSWLPTGTYHKNLAIYLFIILKSFEFGPFFFA
jgi:hypothetical protein